tara:strand:- start:121 stop:378 length:258 start_codon:yes stop_codon:yes gene_type:complete
MQAIVTKYLGPTYRRGSRVKATAQVGSLTLSWDYALNSDANHRAAALALANKYKWLDHCDLSEGGSLPTGNGECFILTRKPRQEA